MASRAWLAGGQRPSYKRFRERIVSFTPDMEKDKHRLWVLYDESESTIQDTFGKDGPYTGFRESRIDWELNGLSRGEPDKFFNHSVEVSEETFNSKVVYVVIVRYCNGGTFGRTNGYWEVPLITNNKEEADQTKDDIRKGNFAGYAPWEGYFAGIEDCYIETVNL